MTLAVRIALSALHPQRTHRLGQDPSQVADLHLPAGPGPFPVVVLLHGGYWKTRYGKLIVRPLARELAGLGWAVWNLEYRRVGPGSGPRRRGGGGGWPMTFDDVAGGIDALATVDAPLDLTRVDVVGHSAGGQLALWASARATLPEGAVGAAPVVPVRRVVALAPVTDMARASGPAELLLGGTADSVGVRWAQADPLRRGAPPVPALVVHGVDDATIPVARSRTYAARTGVELIEVPGSHSDPIDPSTSAWAAAREWLQGDGRTG